MLVFPGESGKLNARLKLPEFMGKEMERITVTVTPGQKSSSGGVNLVMTASSKLFIYKCWDAKHAFIEQLETSYVEDNILRLKALVKNNGNKDIKEVKIEFKLFDSDDNLIKTFTKSDSVKEGKRNQIYVVTDELKPGNYYFEATYTYDTIESSQKLTKEFTAKEKTERKAAVPQTTYSRPVNSVPVQNSAPQVNSIQFSGASRLSSVHYYGFLIAMAVAVGAVFFILGMFVGKHYFLMD